MSNNRRKYNKKKLDKKINKDRFRFIQKQGRLQKEITKMEKRSTDLPSIDEILLDCRKNIVQNYSKNLPEFLQNFDIQNGQYINDIVKKSSIIPTLGRQRKILGISTSKASEFNLKFKNFQTLKSFVASDKIFKTINSNIEQQMVPQWMEQPYKIRQEIVHPTEPKPIKAFLRQETQFFEKNPFSFRNDSTFQTDIIKPRYLSTQQKFRQNQSDQSNFKLRMSNLKSFQSRIRAMISPSVRSKQLDKNSIFKNLVKNIKLEKYTSISPFAQKSAFQESSFYNKLEGKLKKKNIVNKNVPVMPVMEDECNDIRPVQLKKRMYFQGPLDKHQQLEREFKSRANIVKKVIKKKIGSKFIKFKADQTESLQKLRRSTNQKKGEKFTKVQDKILFTILKKNQKNNNQKLWQSRHSQNKYDKRSMRYQTIQDDYFHSIERFNEQKTPRNSQANVTTFDYILQKNHRPRKGKYAYENTKSSAVLQNIVNKVGTHLKKAKRQKKYFDIKIGLVEKHKNDIILRIQTERKKQQDVMDTLVS